MTPPTPQHVFCSEQVSSCCLKSGRIQNRKLSNAVRSLVQRVLCGSSLGRLASKGSLCGSRGVERSCDKRGEAHGMESQAGGKAKKSAGSSGALPSNPKAAKKLKGVKKLLSSSCTRARSSSKRQGGRRAARSKARSSKEQQGAARSSKDQQGAARRSKKQQAERGAASSSTSKQPQGVTRQGGGQVA